MERGVRSCRSRHQGSSGGPDLNAPLVTDRPDFTEASSTVGRGIAQLSLATLTLTMKVD